MHYKGDINGYYSINYSCARYSESERKIIYGM